MNRLKPIFISVATTVWAYFTYVFVIHVTTSGISLIGLGLLLVSLLPFGFFMLLLLLQPVARTTKSLYPFTILISVGMLVIITRPYDGDTSSFYNLIAIISLILWLTYIYWYSYLKPSQIGINVGDDMPELTFIGSDNQQVLSTDFSGKKILYMFYRGNWCPLCMAQIKEISSQYQELEKRGVEVLLISPQKTSKSASLAKKMKVNFHFLTDEKNAMARQLKIDQKYGIPLGFEVLGYDSETVLPTVIITNGEGKVLFIDQTDNYRVRPEPETFLKILDAN